MCFISIRDRVVPLAAAWLLLAASHGAAATPAATVVTIDEADRPTLDGRVDEEVWSSVEPHTGFTQQNPIEGNPASEKTEVRLMLTRTTLYVGVIAYDSEPDQILLTESRRDGALTETDSVQMVFDTFNDNQNAFLFGTTPLGLEYDGQVAGEGLTGGTAFQAGRGGAQRGSVSGFNLNWDGEWSVARAGHRARMGGGARDSVEDAALRARQWKNVGFQRRAQHPPQERAGLSRADPARVQHLPGLAGAESAGPRPPGTS